MGKRVMRLFLAVCIAIVFIFAGCGTGRGKAEVSDYFGDTDPSQAAIVLNCELSEEKGLVRDEGIYLPWDFVWQNIDSAFYYESSSGMLYLTLQDETHTWTEGDGSGYLIIENEEPYVLTDCISAYSGKDIHVFPDPDRVVIQTTWEGMQTAAVKEDTPLYMKAGNKGGVITELSEGQGVIFLADEDGWARISTNDGFTGYVEDTLVTPPEEKKTDETVSGTVFDKLEFGDTVRMVWDFIEFRDDQQYLEAMLENVEGVNVISPTWYTIADTEGNIASLSDSSYVTRAHNMGIAVWPVIGDYTGESGSSGSVLSTESGRRNIINGLMSEADQCGFDGINVDLELIEEEHAADYIQFIRELCAEAHKRSLIVSVDNYVPAYTGYYNRSAQIEACDYIVVMAYDEHTASSSEPGSAASLPFVIQGIEDTMQEVPAERIVLGVPFYSRAWTEYFGEEEFDTQALDMEGARNFIKEKGIDVYLYWSEVDGQFYGTSTDSSARYSIWQEEENSLELKLDLVNNYSLAGAAAWRLGYEEDAIWKTWTDCLGK